MCAVPGRPLKAGEGVLWGAALLGLLCGESGPNIHVGTYRDQGREWEHSVPSTPRADGQAEIFVVAEWSDLSWLEAGSVGSHSLHIDPSYVTPISPIAAGPSRFLLVPAHVLSR